jgi:hypothetical protein
MLTTSELVPSSINLNTYLPGAKSVSWTRSGTLIVRWVSLFRSSILSLPKGYGSFQSAWRTLQGIEAVNMIRKGRVRWLANGNVVGQAHFIGTLFGLST